MGLMDMISAAIIGAELDFLGSLQYNEALYKIGGINKMDYEKAIKDEKRKKDAILEKLNKKLKEELDKDDLARKVFTWSL